MGAKKRASAVTTFIGSEARIDGTLEFEGTIRVDGTVTGRIRSAEGTLIVGEQAAVDAEIEVDAAVVMGKVHGTIDAADRIEAYPPCRLSGDIQAPVISIEAGVVFNGTCTMKEDNVTAIRTPKNDRRTETAEGE
jgi:cytoskeletal protein CcmA (bactofilin family)